MLISENVNQSGVTCNSVKTIGSRVAERCNLYRAYQWHFFTQAWSIYFNQFINLGLLSSSLSIAFTFSPSLVLPSSLTLCLYLLVKSLILLLSLSKSSSHPVSFPICLFQTLLSFSVYLSHTYTFLSFFLSLSKSLSLTNSVSVFLSEFSSSLFLTHFFRQQNKNLGLTVHQQIELISWIANQLKKFQASFREMFFAAFGISLILFGAVDSAQKK